jgi:TPR repeat protein
MAILSAPVAAQQDSGPPTRAELDRQSAEAMATSEAKVKAWFADPQVQALKARADGGDKNAQVNFADRIRDNILNEIWSRDNILQSMMRYYAMAMAQNHGPAFARIGALAEFVKHSSAMGRSTRDLGEAFINYGKGAELGDREAIAGYVRIALNPNFCSFCEDKGKVSFDLGKMKANGVLGTKEGYENEYESIRGTYRAEKRASIAKALKFASAARLDPGDPASHQLAAALLTGIRVPDAVREKIYTSDKAVLGIRPTDDTPQWLLLPDLPKAERILLELSMRGDVLATRKLADLYLKGRQASPSVSIAQSPENYLYHMSRAVQQGSIIAASDLGFELLSGRSIPANPSVGFDVAAKAAIAGYGPAEMTIAYALREGRGAPKDEKLALQLFQRAADHGEIDGAVQAAAMYRAGQGTESGGVEVVNAAAFEQKAERMRALSPAMADLVRRSHREKFQ